MQHACPKSRRHPTCLPARQLLPVHACMQASNWLAGLLVADLVEVLPEGRVVDGAVVERRQHLHHLLALGHPPVLEGHAELVHLAATVQGRLGRLGTRIHLHAPGHNNQQAGVMREGASEGHGGRLWVFCQEAMHAS